MNELTIFTNVCLTCKYRAEMQQIRQFASKHKLTVVTKRTNYSKQYQEEAKEIGHDLPFVKLGNATVPFKGITSGQLELMV